MPNPPKMDPARGARGRGITYLPASGRKGIAPKWPSVVAPDNQVAQVWAEVWASPQAVAWEGMGPATAREVARYCRLLVESEQPGAKAAVHAQLTALADRLGLTPKSMRLLLWAITPDELAERREERGGRGGARDRIKAV